MQAFLVKFYNLDVKDKPNLCIYYIKIDVKSAMFFTSILNFTYLELLSNYLLKATTKA